MKDLFDKCILDKNWNTKNTFSSIRLQCFAKYDVIPKIWCKKYFYNLDKYILQFGQIHLVPAQISSVLQNMMCDSENVVQHWVKITFVKVVISLHCVKKREGITFQCAQNLDRIIETPITMRRGKC